MQIIRTKRLKYIRINANERQGIMCKQNSLVEDVNVHTDCTGSRNIYCRGTGLEIR